MTNETHPVLKDSNASDIEILVAELTKEHRNLRISEIVGKDTTPLQLLNALPREILDKPIRFIGAIWFDSLHESLKDDLLSRTDRFTTKLCLVRHAIADACKRAHVLQKTALLAHCFNQPVSVTKKVVESVGNLFEIGDFGAIDKLAFIAEVAQGKWDENERHLAKLVVNLANSLGSFLSER